MCINIQPNSFTVPNCTTEIQTAPPSSYTRFIHTYVCHFILAYGNSNIAFPAKKCVGTWHCNLVSREWGRVVARRALALAFFLSFPHICHPHSPWHSVAVGEERGCRLRWYLLYTRLFDVRAYWVVRSCTAGRVVVAKKSSIMKRHVNLFHFYRVKGEIALSTLKGTRVLLFVRVWYTVMIFHFIFVHFAFFTVLCSL